MNAATNTMRSTSIRTRILTVIIKNTKRKKIYDYLLPFVYGELFTVAIEEVISAGAKEVCCFDYDQDDLGQMGLDCLKKITQEIKHILSGNQDCDYVIMIVPYQAEKEKHNTVAKINELAVYLVGKYQKDWVWGTGKEDVSGLINGMKPSLEYPIVRLWVLSKCEVEKLLESMVGGKR
ncbi:hypothetical protein KQH40_00865 [bacterium]|nr:hypothetical protein [bacterium]